MYIFMYGCGRNVLSHVEYELLTILKHLSSPQFFFNVHILVVCSLAHFIELHIFVVFLVPRCDVRYDFLGSFSFSFVLSGVQVLFILVVFLRMSVPFNSNRTGITSGAGIANLSGNLSSAHDFSGVRVFQSLFLFVMFCRSLFFLLLFFA